MIDSQSVKRAQRGQLEQGFDGYKKVKERKRHVVVDVLGLMLGCYVFVRRMSPMVKQRCSVLVPVIELYKRLGKVLADLGVKGELDSCLKAAYKCVLEKASPFQQTLMLSCRVVAMARRTNLCLVGQCPSVMPRWRDVYFSSFPLQERSLSPSAYKGEAMALNRGRFRSRGGS